MTSEALRPSSAGTVGQVGTVVAGRYTLLELVRPPDDHGTSLWRAEDEILHRTVAVHLQEPGGPNAYRLLSAAKIGGRVSHPGLANVFDAGDAGSHAYVISEWVDGTPLSLVVLRLGTIEDADAADMLDDVSQAIEAAHREGVVHGRLTPDRVMLTDSGIRITGIGFAAVDATTDDDVQGLGGLLYAMITGYWPLAERTSLPRVHLRRGRIPEPRHVMRTAPPDLAQLCMRILQPEGRPGGPIRSAASLNAVLATRPWTTSSKPPPKGFWAWRIALLAVIVSAALVGWVLGTLIGSVPEGEQVVPRAIVPEVDGPQADQDYRVNLPDSPTQAPPAPVVVAGSRSFDPYGDGRETDQLVPMASDGDPGTWWKTETYFSSPDFAGLKPGVGLLFDLGRPADIRTIVTDLPMQGLSFQIRASDIAGGSLDDYPVVAQATAAGSTVETELTASVRAQYWVFWLTDLVQDGQSSTSFRGGLSEVTFNE